MRYVLGHLELADFIIYSYLGINRIGYFPFNLDEYMKYEIHEYYYLKEHVKIIKEFFK